MYGANLNSVRRSGRDTGEPHLGCAIDIVRMKKLYPVIAFDFFSREASVIEQASIAVIDRSVRSSAPKHFRNGFGQLAQVKFAVPQFLFCVFAILDVGVCPIPSSDGSAFVLKGFCAKQEPAIHTVEAAHARLGFAGLPRREDPSPCIGQCRQVVRVDRS